MRFCKGINEMNSDVDKYISIIKTEEKKDFIDEKDYANKLKDIISTFSLTKEKINFGRWEDNILSSISFILLMSV